MLKKHLLKFGAGNEARTRDPDLGKVVLYQLSYSRRATFNIMHECRKQGLLYEDFDCSQVEIFIFCLFAEILV